MLDQPTEYYPGTWFTRSTPHLGYRVLPKCACTSVGQLLHYLDHGSFYAGDVHDENVPLLKWRMRDDPQLQEIERTLCAFCFTFVRNPFARLLSTFTDKILSIQTNGRHYRNGMIHRALSSFGVECDKYVEWPDLFKSFVRLVARTIDTRQPFPPDVHWRPCSYQLLFSVRRAPTWKLEFVGHVERLNHDLNIAMTMAGVDPSRLPENIPRENAKAHPAMPIERYYGPEEIETVQRVYQHDFDLFHYSPDPQIREPLRCVDVGSLNAALRELEAQMPLTAEE